MSDETTDEMLYEWLKEQMATLQRYDVEPFYNGVERIPNDDGLFVAWEDIEKLMKEIT